VIYEAHLYFDHNKSGRYTKSYEKEEGTPTIGIERLKGFRDWITERNAIGFVGEFGVPANDDRWLAALSNFTKHLREIQMSGCYWAGGPWWGDYPLSLEPKDGEDRPQMRALVSP
jgi:endoglucanase